MHRIAIKPLSVNEAYRGRRFATNSLKTYKKALSLLLPKIIVPSSNLRVSYRFGVSSHASDADNCIKALQDALAEQYGFNDKKIYRIEVEKVDVKKGSEFLEFDIAAL
ncbi:MAG: RusA family crossover junction endodeoxyribonuclease [Minisyncoccia bacterium]